VGESIYGVLDVNERLRTLWPEHNCSRDNFSGVSIELKSIGNPFTTRQTIRRKSGIHNALAVIENAEDHSKPLGYLVLMYDVIPFKWAISVFNSPEIVDN